jgi:ABC-type antimicrobial peptide transport system ATPase subunit
MSNTICPYPGLRPFNEEESIFFKGREQQVERLVKRLEEKKFLMVNGASGDGKSSLIYAGVIPYAKAGFFKAKYNNWIVADFRPERSSLKNLTTSLCKQFKIDDHAKTLNKFKQKQILSNSYRVFDVLATQRDAVGCISSVILNVKKN